MKSPWLPLTIGIIAGVVAAGAVVAPTLVARRAAATKGWNLVPVVVAAVDIPEGQALTFDQLSQRSVPESFVTRSNVPPDEARVIIGKRVCAPIQAGDLIVWQDFAALDDRVKRCTEQISPAVVAAGDAVRSRAAAAFAEGLAPLGVTGEVRRPIGNVVLAAADIPEGCMLTREMLTAGPYAPELITASDVPAERMADLVGSRTIAPIQKGDVVLWQLLDSGQRPRARRSCELAISKVVHEERERAAAREVEKLP